MDKSNTEESSKTPGFFDKMMEDNSPEIGIGTKEPLGEYFKGVKSEFKRIEWPNREQVTQEFFTVIVIVTIITCLIFLIDIGLDSLIKFVTN